MKSNTEKILWKAIKDIEEGNVEFISVDPINGFLKGRNKFLSKKNISDQSAKYTGSLRPISRPTIDKHEKILKYINNGINKENKNFKNESDKILLLIKKNKELSNKLKESKNLNKKLAFENYKLLKGNNI
jgi:hypothetical protein